MVPRAAVGTSQVAKPCCEASIGMLANNLNHDHLSVLLTNRKEWIASNYLVRCV